ncbi:DNA glycosylase AlkZ-like family protein [Sandaracinus amylolyticus]|uniref:DNA glycosylase AlkZ-like family protein n=1 Tax=Sandaracinus amylolyticus TaxID=927083 RepID=UPI001F1CB642|nr:crosslink repair DNA glycosylase YcaQ family protein [Sandaracinus amylolyticus]
MTTTTLSREEARAFLVSQLGLARPRRERGGRGVRAMLDALRCVQLDPLDPMGTNADLVALARVDGIAKGDLFAHTLPGHAFEHFAKERCLLPARAFPHYRDQAAETPWWRLGDRLRRLPAGVIDAVREEVAARGPIAAGELEDRGRVEPIDWSGWKGTGRAASMAIEVLWTRCEIVVAGRTARAKLWDVPRRALPDQHDVDVAGHGFAAWALRERVEAAGLLSRAGGAMWSMLRDARTDGTIEQLFDEGAIEEVAIDGARRSYLAPAGFRERRVIAPDDRMRILGPLDPVLWDRDLVRHAFDFDYVWEVYKPASERRFGWYVVPLLHRGRFVGRLEGHVDGATLVIDRVWREDGIALDEDALDAALERHATACGCDRVVRRPGARRRAAR